MNNHETNPPATLPTSLMIPVASLLSSTWNTHAANQDDDGSLDELSASIARNGVISRLIVRPVENGDKFEVVDGHRRLRAAIAAGLSEVPCDVKMLTDDEAQIQTLVANIQRLANDPILEANLISRMAEDGKPVDEIAATIGKSRDYVVRRARLTALTGAWRSVAREKKLGIAALEEVARYDPKLQDKVLEELCEWEDWTASNIRSCFKRLMRSLSSAPFPKDKCASCPYNTAATASLFPDMDGENAMCENAECFVSSWNRHIDRKIEQLRKKGCEIQESKSRYEIPQSWKASERQSETNTAAYVCKEGDVRRILWSVPAPEMPSAPALTAEEKAAAKEEKRRIKILRKAREKLRSFLRNEGKRNLLATHESLCSTFDGIARRYLSRVLESSWAPDDLVDEIAVAFIGLPDFNLDEEEIAAFQTLKGNTQKKQATAI